MPAFLLTEFPRYRISASRNAECHVHLDRNDHLSRAQVCVRAAVTVCQISATAPAAAAAHLENALKLLLSLLKSRACSYLIIQSAEYLFRRQADSLTSCSYAKQN